MNTMLDLMHEFIEEKTPFHKLLGIKIDSLENGHICLRFDMRETLVGNFQMGNLHGGVISSVLDAAGGFTAWMAVAAQMEQESIEVKLKRLSKLGTIDLRIDYLRPGRGNYFLATGSILRTGNKVAVTRMELHNDEQLLIAVGTGTYIVG